MKRFTALKTALLALLVAAGAAGGTPVPEPIPASVSSSPAFEWKRSTPEEQGVDTEMLLESVRRIRENDLDVRSLVFLRNDHIILELYVHPYGRDTLHNVKSVSKSIISALVGIALEEKILESLDQTVSEFYPQYFTEGMDERKKAITLRHLITMTAGLDLDENGPKMAKVIASNDWIRATFEAPMTNDPGAAYLYSTPLTHTMSGILTEASGMSLLEFADRHLFGPLGVEERQWAKGPMGYYVGGAEMFLRPIDMAKFGRLYLHGGRWQGEQLVPTAWVAESTRNQVPEGSNTNYGYWWVLGVKDGEVTAYKASGWGGQGITVIPGHAVVIAGTSGDPRARKRMLRSFDPASFADEPLPPNPEAVAELDRLVRELESPKPRPIPPLPAIAGEISGRTWLVDDNPRDYNSIAFIFGADPTAFRVVVEQAGETFDADVGLDGLYRFVDMGTEGGMPEGNRAGVRGHWTETGELVLDFHEIGNPVHPEWTVRFDGDRLEVSVAVKPTERSFVITGAASPTEAGVLEEP